MPGTKILALGGAPRGVVLGVEVKHVLLALQLLRVHGQAAGGLGGEGGDGLVKVDAHC